jgi:hypothetical protein
MIHNATPLQNVTLAVVAFYDLVSTSLGYYDIYGYSAYCSKTHNIVGYSTAVAKYSANFVYLQ